MGAFQKHSLQKFLPFLCCFLLALPAAAQIKGTGTKIDEFQFPDGLQTGGVSGASTFNDNDANIVDTCDGKDNDGDGQIDEDSGEDCQKGEEEWTCIETGMAPAQTACFSDTATGKITCISSSDNGVINEEFRITDYGQAKGLIASDDGSKMGWAQGNTFYFLQNEGDASLHTVESTNLNPNTIELPEDIKLVTQGSQFLYFATENHLYLLNETLGLTDMGPARDVEAIVADRQGNLYVLEGDGIMRVITNTLDPSKPKVALANQSFNLMQKALAIGVTFNPTHATVETTGTNDKGEAINNIFMANGNQILKLDVSSGTLSVAAQVNLDEPISTVLFSLKERAFYITSGDGFYSVTQNGDKEVTVTEIASGHFDQASSVATGFLYCPDPSVPQTGDECSDGKGMSINVDDGNVCTIDSCDPQTGTVYHMPVDDGMTCGQSTDGCSLPPTCQSGVCAETGPIQLDDDNGCTEQTCDPATGEISTTTAEGCCLSDADCNDGNACSNDACVKAPGQNYGTCSYSSISSDDNNPCTEDSCDPAMGVIREAVNTDDGNVCTTDSCDVDSGVTHIAIQTDDGNACTSDSCDATTGISHVALNVDDGIDCTIDACNPQTGEITHEVTSSCNDDDEAEETTDLCSDGKTPTRGLLCMTNDKGSASTALNFVCYDSTGNRVITMDGYPSPAGSISTENKDVLVFANGTQINSISTAFSEGIENEQRTVADYTVQTIDSGETVTDMARVDNGVVALGVNGKLTYVGGSNDALTPTSYSSGVNAAEWLAVWEKEGSVTNVFVGSAGVLSAFEASDSGITLVDTVDLNTHASALGLALDIHEARVMDNTLFLTVPSSKHILAFDLEQKSMGAILFPFEVSSLVKMDDGSLVVATSDGKIYAYDRPTQPVGGQIVHASRDDFTLMFEDDLVNPVGMAFFENGCEARLTNCSAETCDGQDNDCDGVVDNGVTNACGSCGDVPEETCNDADDDCDGVADEDCECTGDETRECGTGACGGIQSCQDGTWGDTCEGATSPSEEVCDDVDNDCDGEVDEGETETCDEKDNDCDGSVDEGLDCGTPEIANVVDSEPVTESEGCTYTVETEGVSREKAISIGEYEQALKSPITKTYDGLEYTVSVDGEGYVTIAPKTTDSGAVIYKAATSEAPALCTTTQYSGKVQFSVAGGGCSLKGNGNIGEGRDEFALALLLGFTGIILAIARVNSPMPLRRKVGDRIGQ